MKGQTIVIKVLFYINLFKCIAWHWLFTCLSYKSPPFQNAQISIKPPPPLQTTSIRPMPVSLKKKNPPKTLICPNIATACQIPLALTLFATLDISVLFFVFLFIITIRKKIKPKGKPTVTNFLKNLRKGPPALQSGRNIILMQHIVMNLDKWKVNFLKKLTASGYLLKVITMVLAFCNSVSLLAEEIRCGNARYFRLHCYLFQRYETRKKHFKNHGCLKDRCRLSQCW